MLAISSRGLFYFSFLNFIVMKHKKANHAISWLQRENITHMKQAWENFKRADWLIWLAQELEVKDSTLMFAAARCVESVPNISQDHAKEIAVAIAYASGLATKEDFETAAVKAEAARVKAHVSNTASKAEKIAATAISELCKGNYTRAVALAVASSHYHNCDSKETQKRAVEICREILDEVVQQYL